MKRLIMFFGIMVLFGVIAAPLSSWGWRGMGFGPFMDRGPDPAMGPRMGGFPIEPFCPLTEEECTQMDEMNKKFLEETAEFRESLFEKSKELNTILASEEPDEKKAKALQKEISDLQAKLAEKRLDYRLEMARIFPESGPGMRFRPGLGIHPRMDGFPQRSGFNPLTEEQRNQLKELNKKFREETDALREDLASRFGELRKALNSEKPDEKKAKALQKEISELQAKLSQKTLDLRLESRKILPETGYAGGYGRGFGPPRGHAPHMGRGRGMGRAPGFY